MVQDVADGLNPAWGVFLADLAQFSQRSPGPRSLDKMLYCYSNTSACGCEWLAWGRSREGREDEEGEKGAWLFLLLRGPAEVEAAGVAVRNTQSGLLGSASLATILGQSVSLWNFFFRSFMSLLEHPRELSWFLSPTGCPCSTLLGAWYQPGHFRWTSKGYRVLPSAAGEVIQHRYYFMAPYALALAYKWSAWTTAWSLILTSPLSPLKAKGMILVHNFFHL